MMHRWGVVGGILLGCGVTVALAVDSAIFEKNAELHIEAQNGSAGEGPAWHPEWGVFTSGNGHIYQLRRDGSSVIFRKNAGTNGLLWDAQGRLLACEPVQRRVTRTERDGNITVLTDHYQGKKYNQPNDITVDSQGRIYFSDPRYGDRKDMQQRDEQGRTIEGVLSHRSEWPSYSCDWA